VTDDGQLRLFDPCLPESHRLREAVERTVAGLVDAGRLERCDDFLVELALVSADGVDELDGDPDRLCHGAQLLKVAYGCEQALRRLLPAPDDAFDRLLAVATEGVEPAV
jgi:hypothetical protein